MIAFHTLEVCNVGTYKGEHTLRLDNPGFNLILGRSGAGKSTLFRALSFLLYGVVEGSGAQRAKGDLIHAARRKGIRAAVTFSADGIEYVAEWRYKHEGVTGRFLSKAGRPWSGYTEKDTLGRIRDVLQMTYAQFLTSVYLPQRGSSIIVSGSAAERWRYIATLSDTDSLDLLAERIKERLQGYTADQGKADAWAEHKAELEAELEDLGDKRSLTALRKHHRRLVGVHMKRLHKVQRAISKHEAAEAVERERASLEASMVRPSKPEGLDVYIPETAKAERQRAKALLERKLKHSRALEALAKLDAPEKSADKLSEAQDRLSAKIAKVRADLHSAQEKLEGIESQQASGVCHACDRPFDENHDAAGLAKQAAKAKKRINKLTAEGQALKMQSRELRSAYQTALAYEQWKARVDEIEPVTEEEAAEAQDTLDATSQWAEVRNAYRADYAAYKRTKAALDALPDVERPELGLDAAKNLAKHNKGKLEAARNAYAKVDSALDAIADLEDRIAKADEKIRQVKRRLRRAGVLEQMLEAVRDARQGRIEAVTELLTQLASKHYPDPAGATFTADMGARKFDILLHRKTSEGKDYSLSTRQLSGGELDMATIAFMFAVQELATSRIQSNLLVLDEAAAHMDDDGWDLLLDRLRESAEGKSVFVVSHRKAAKEAQVWDHIIQVKKTKGDSTLAVRR